MTEIRLNIILYVPEVICAFEQLVARATAISTCSIRGGPLFSHQLIHSRDVTCAGLANAAAPASRSGKQGWLATRLSVRWSPVTA